MDENEIQKIFKTGSKENKISMLENLSNSKTDSIINIVISMLDDPDIEVRGEAFASLVLNENDISKNLIQSLHSESKNIRSFSALVLANRRNSDAVSEIMKLTNDASSMVRSCAVGALGHLKAKQASQVIQNCFSDSNLEVKKSAIKAAMDIVYRFSKDDIKKLSVDTDEELEKLILQAKTEV